MTFKLSDVNRLMDNARVSLPGALDAAIWQEIFNVISEFCDKSNIWYEDIDFTVDPTSQMGDTVDIEASTGGRINRLIYVAFNNNGSLTQRNMSMPQPGVLQFGAAADNTTPWTARVALCPADPVPTSGALQGIPVAPDWLLQQYHLGLLSGVIARMCAQPAKPYSNPKLVGLHMAKFNVATAQAKTEFRKQNLFNGQCWQFPQAGVTRSRQ